MPSEFASLASTAGAPALMQAFGERGTDGRISDSAALIDLGQGHPLPVRAILSQERSEMEFDENGNTRRVMRREIDIPREDLIDASGPMPFVRSIPARSRVQIGNLVYAFESSEDQDAFVRLTLRRDPLTRLNMMEDQAGGAV